MVFTGYPGEFHDISLQCGFELNQHTEGICHGTDKVYQYHASNEDTCITDNVTQCPTDLWDHLFDLQLLRSLSAP